MGNNIDYEKLSQQPQKSITVEKNNIVFQETCHPLEELKQKKVQNLKFQSEVFEPQKIYQEEQTKRFHSEICLGHRQRFDQLSSKEINEDESLRTTFGSLDADQRHMTVNSDPIGKKEKYDLPLVEFEEINIRTVQKKMYDMDYLMPESISNIGNSQGRQEILETVLSEEKFAEYLLKKNKEIINSQLNAEDETQPIEKNKKTRSLLYKLRKIEVESEPQDIQEEKLQEKCLEIFGINFKELPLIFQKLFEAQPSNEENYS